MLCQPPVEGVDDCLLDAFIEEVDLFPKTQVEALILYTHSSESVCIPFVKRLELFCEAVVPFNQVYMW